MILYKVFDDLGLHWFNSEVYKVSWLGLWSCGFFRKPYWCCERDMTFVSDGTMTDDRCYTFQTLLLWWTLYVLSPLLPLQMKLYVQSLLLCVVRPLLNVQLCHDCCLLDGTVFVGCTLSCWNIYTNGICLTKWCCW